MQARLLLSVLLAALAFSMAFGDEVKKKDGRSIEGAIVSEDDESVTIRNDLGDITIQKKDVASINGKPVVNLEDRLEHVKRSAAVELEEIAQEAEKGGKAEAAKRARELLDQVKGWSLKPEKQERKKDERAEKVSDRVRSGRELYSRFCEKITAITKDESLTDVKRAKALEAVRAEFVGKKVFLSIRIRNVSAMEDGIGKYMAVTGVVFEGEVTLAFRDRRDFERLEKAARDSSVSFEATIGMGQYSNEAEVNDLHLR